VTSPHTSVKKLAARGAAAALGIVGSVVISAQSAGASTLGCFGRMFAFDREQVHQAPPWAGTTYTATVEFSDGREMDCCDQGQETMEHAEECARGEIAGCK
jgi:hypothetical protein